MGAHGKQLKWPNEAHSLARLTMATMTVEKEQEVSNSNFNKFPSMPGRRQTQKGTRVANDVHSSEWPLASQACPC